MIARVEAFPQIFHFLRHEDPPVPKKSRTHPNTLQSHSMVKTSGPRPVLPKVNQRDAKALLTPSKQRPVLTVNLHSRFSTDLDKADAVQETSARKNMIHYIHLLILTL
jgi:hypothetical protein